MKKNLIFLLIGVTFCSLFVGCNRLETNEKNVSHVAQFYVGDVLITIYEGLVEVEGAPLQTKSNSDATSYTVLGQLNEVKYATYAVNEYLGDRILISKVYSQGGTLLFTDTIVDDEIESRVYNSMLDFIGEDDFETKGKKPGEKYGECVKRTIKENKNATAENTPILCDFIGCCGAISATIAVVDCAQN